MNRAMPAPPEDFDRHVRRVDPERWLATRLIADPAARTEVLALYALDDELARIAPSVSQPMLGEIRLQWWREALERAAQGGAADHPVIEALAPALAVGRLAAAALDALIDAHARELDPRPFSDEAALVAWLDARFGSAMALAARLLEPRARSIDIAHAARAWGWSRLPRLAEAWEARGGSLWPPGLFAADAPRRIRATLVEAQQEVRALPTAAFPAVAHAALSRRPDAPELVKRAALVWAAARGAV